MGLWIANFSVDTTAFILGQKATQGLLLAAVWTAVQWDSTYEMQVRELKLRSFCTEVYF